jgi:methylmalonyl-CoA/ethylmalonyl-CoA epimerase
MPRVISIDHIAMLVADMESSLAFWRDGLGLPLDRLSDVPEEASKIAFLPAADSQIELVEPTSKDSGVARYLTKHGPGMHHICLEVEDLAGMLLRMREKGFRLINEQPRTMDDGTRYAFVHPEAAGGVLVELYERPAGSAAT